MHIYGIIKTHVFSRVNGVVTQDKWCSKKIPKRALVIIKYSILKSLFDRVLIINPEGRHHCRPSGLIFSGVNKFRFDRISVIFFVSHNSFLQFKQRITLTFSHFSFLSFFCFITAALVVGDFFFDCPNNVCVHALIGVIGVLLYFCIKRSVNMYISYDFFFIYRFLSFLDNF